MSSMFQTILRSIAAAMCLRFLGRFERFAAVGGSDGVLRGFGEWLEEDPRGRFCMLNRRNYTRNGHDWNPMPDMELESLRGVRIFGRRFAKRGVRTNSPNPPLVTGLILPNVNAQRQRKLAPNNLMTSLREHLKGGSYLLKGDSRKGGFGQTLWTPPPPPRLRACSARQRDINDSETVFRNTRSPFDRDMYLFVKFCLFCLLI